MDFFVIVLLLVVLLMSGMIVFLLLKNGAGTNMREYDERQKLVQGNAAKWGFGVLIAYLFIVGLVDLISDIMWAPFLIEAFIGVMLGLGTYASVCIFMDAYVAISVKPGRILLMLGGICLMNLGICLPYFFDGTDGFITDGMLNLHSLNLMCAIMLFILFWEMVAKIAINKSGEARGE